MFQRSRRDHGRVVHDDVASLTAFVTALVNGLSILARDGASRATLNAAVGHALAAWDRTVGAK